MFTFKHYQGETLHVGAKLALDNHLFVVGWQLQGILNQLTYEHDTRSQLVLASSGSVTVGCVLYEAGSNSLQAFVRKPFRRNGIASQCIRRMKDLPSNIGAAEGIDGSLIFWSKNGVHARQRDYNWWPIGSMDNY